MKRAAVVVLAFLLVVPTGSAQSPLIPGEYPEPVEDAVESVIDGAPENRSERSQGFIDRAQTELEAGNLSMAIQNYAHARVADEGDRLVRELEGMGAEQGQSYADQRIDRFLREARASAELARGELDELALQNLTKQGLDTALWASALIARGETRLNVHETELPTSIYNSGKLNEGNLEQRLHASVGASVLIAMGLEIASRATQVDGDPMDAERMHERLSAAANITVTVPQSGKPDFLPTASPGESALYRTGLLYVTMVELRLPNIQVSFGHKSDAKTLADMTKAFQFDRGRLGPYAEAGFPFARAGFETIAFRNADQLQDPVRDDLQRAHARALATSEIERTVFPNATEDGEDEAPTLGALTAASLVGVAALAARRRER